MGTAIETEQELDSLMNHTGEAVKILSSIKSDESDQECWPLGDISL